MLIVDLKLPGGTAERVGVVGSCRVHDPIKAVISAGRGKFLWSANNSFTHTPQEAVQHIGFCRNTVDVPDSFAPFIFRQDTTPPAGPKLSALVDSCRTFIVEISSREFLRCGRFFFNYDYFSQRFVRGNGLGVLEWFRALSDTEPSEALVERAKQSILQSGGTISASVEEILVGARFGAMDEATFAAGIREVVFDSSRHWIFVPLFNVSEQPGEAIAKRTELRALLHRVVTPLNLDFLDPTPLVAKHGRAAALEHGGRDTFHYASAFLPRVGDFLYNAVVELSRSVA